MCVFWGFFVFWIALLPVSTCRCFPFMARLHYAKCGPMSRHITALQKSLGRLRLSTHTASMLCAFGHRVQVSRLLGVFGFSDISFKHSCGFLMFLRGCHSGESSNLCLQSWYAMSCSARGISYGFYLMFYGLFAISYASLYDFCGFSHGL